MTDLAQYFSVAQAINLLLYPYGEVVIHDLRTGKTAAIFNNMSKRKVGDESLLDEGALHPQLPDVFPVYAKINWDGRKMKSTTATLRDKKGKPIALLCINLDVSQWDNFGSFLNQWLSYQDQPETLFKEDWREKINLYVTDYLKNEGTTLKMLSKAGKQALVKALHREGAFNAKHAASYVADVLDVSRATIYNYLRSANAIT